MNGEYHCDCETITEKIRKQQANTTTATQIQLKNFDSDERHGMRETDRENG